MHCVFLGFLRNFVKYQCITLKRTFHCSSKTCPSVKVVCNKIYLYNMWKICANEAFFDEKIFNVIFFGFDQGIDELFSTLYIYIPLNKDKLVLLYERQKILILR